MTSGGKISEGIFKGETINTPSMLAVEDALDGLKWGEQLGGLKALIGRSQANFAALSKFVAASSWLDFLAVDPASRSNTSVCLLVKAPWFKALDDKGQQAAAKRIVDLLEAEKVAYDIGHYRDAPPGLRIWCGSTVETADIEALCPWLDWAFAQVESEMKKAA
jgi:phosphoserine aminotransferase